MSILKLSLGEEIRRVGKAPETIDEVKSKTVNLFGIEDPSFRYKDEDGDLITIQTQDEYQEALKVNIRTLKLEVIDSQVLLMKRSSYMIGSFTSTPSDTFAYESLEKSLKPISKTLDTTKEEIKADFDSVFVQTESVIFKDKETEMASKIDKQINAKFSEDFSSNFGIGNDQAHDFQIFLKEMLERNMLKPELNVKNIEVCVICTKQIYNQKFECKICKIVLCNDCEKSNEDMHPLLKTRFLRAEEVKLYEKTPHKFENKIEPVVIQNYVALAKETPKGHRDDLFELLNQLKIMGFSDETKSIGALIKANYRVEIATEFLLNQT